MAEPAAKSRIVAANAKFFIAILHCGQTPRSHKSNDRTKMNFYLTIALGCLHRAESSRKRDRNSRALPKRYSPNVAPNDPLFIEGLRVGKNAASQHLALPTQTHRDRQKAIRSPPQIHSLPRKCRPRNEYSSEELLQHRAGRTS